MNKKGFTLIELLAVLVILGVLLGIAIPKVTQYITKSKKEGFISSGEFFIDSVKKDITSEFYAAPVNNNDVTIVTFDSANLDKSKQKSSFGGKYVFNKSYVAVVNVGTGAAPDYRYYVASQDTKNYAIPLTQESLLDSSLVVANAKNKMEVTIQSLCGTSDGYKTTLAEISGLTDVQPVDENGNKISWNVTIYSSSECGSSE